MERQLSLLEQGYYTPQEKKKTAPQAPQPRAFEVWYPPDIWLRCSVCNCPLSTARLHNGRPYCEQHYPEGLK
jgi:hypothetical protein